MDLRDWEKKLMAATPDFSEFGAKYFEKHSSAWTGMAPEGIVGAAGVTAIFPSTYEAWAYTTPLFHKYAKDVHRTVKRILNLFFSFDGVNRIQCLVDARHNAAVKWAMKLGFEVESIMKKYGPEGQNFYLMARVKQ